MGESIISTEVPIPTVKRKMRQSLSKWMHSCKNIFNQKIEEFESTWQKYNLLWKKCVKVLYIDESKIELDSNTRDYVRISIYTTKFNPKYNNIP